jgi:hypothetical protein
LAAERGVKAAYVQRGHEHACEEEADDDSEPKAQQPGEAAAPAQNGTVKPR